ncbi:phage tail protein [Providencia rettgeri]|uniref:phage tail-collar fiber domain-containing protein n=1 Tax=Providencia rettgeri TaxID=587 RepID=UPI001BA90D9E|nr:phage tail protein [Providencia rettgeri]MBS0858619.1 phage tail protein [Providencia rettgeri]MBS0872357.1 phage tail protein [Providencia rettgeri]MBS0919503.1 phage tail protein [Providencia rettgeri]
MKYFALLTKLGENLLAQATALGTKLELTHMAVGDGGGSLPTPDTNQTKLIAEKRRAAINTLFIDDKNKNQIIAEQIIPEQDGGWWIREIGLFDKAGNLIAVANCPETYKPQLAEGSGRTQSIRIVLIVSHTESVTLKIDPSVVLATREYVNTEITVLDKKIDALSAQTKLDLNKKFDKANISGVKGNDNDKVPSLHLFTTEIGKLAVIGYSYSKIESDGRYQPKGNYAPAGDYVTNTALTNGLDKKFDKTGGTITGSVTIKYARLSIGGTSNYSGIGLTRADSSNLILETNPTDDKSLLTIVDRTASGSNRNVVTIPNKSGTAMLVGDFGFGNRGLRYTFPATELEEMIRSPSTPTQIFRYEVQHTSYSYRFSPTLYMGTGDTFATLSIEYGTGKVKIAAGSQNSAVVYNDLYGTANTVTDRNGYLKVLGAGEYSDYPVGSPIPWPQSSPPNGYLICNGQSFNKTTYPLLAKAYPSGVLPDLRSEFIRGLDSGRNIDNGRVVLSSQGDAIREIEGWVEANSLKADGVFGNTYTSWTYCSPNGGGRDVMRTTFKASNVVPTANENRPRNVAFLYIVRAA